MGNPDLSSAERGGPAAAGRPPGLVVFPIESLVPGARRERGGLGWLREWWIVFAALVVAALVIAAALLLR